MVYNPKDMVNMAVSGTPGTGTITLGSAVSSYISFAAAGVSNGDTFDALIVDGSARSIESGCVYNSSGTTVTRGTVTQSTTGARLSLTSSATIGIAGVAAAAKAVYDKLLNVSANKLIGTVTAGVAGEIDCTSAGRALLSGAGSPGVCHGRLTLESGVPISTTDQTAKTTVYFTPFNGSHISLYTSSAWTDYTFTEMSIALGTLTSGANYDVFAYDVAGAVTLKIGPAWSSDTSRGTGAGTTELTTQNGVYVNAVSITSGPGAGAGVYLGTFRTTSTTTTEDSQDKRFVWNTYNRVARPMGNSCGATNWSYSTSSWREVNNSPSYRRNIVAGLVGDAISLNSTLTPGGGTTYSNAWAYDSATVPTTSAGFVGGRNNGPGYTALSTVACHTPGIGYHYYSLLEHASGASAAYSSLDGINMGIVASWRC